MVDSGINESHNRPSHTHVSDTLRARMRTDIAITLKYELKVGQIYGHVGNYQILASGDHLIR